MLKELLMLLFILIIIIIIYTMNEDEKKDQIEGFENSHNYYIGGERDETIYNQKGKKLMEINKKDELILFTNNNKIINIKQVNSAPDPYHYIFEYNNDNIKIFPKNGEANIIFDDESKKIKVYDNKNKSITYFKFRDKIVCKAKISDNNKYKYMFKMDDINIINLLPIYFVTFVLLQREEDDE